MGYAKQHSLKNHQQFEAVFDSNQKKVNELLVFAYKKNHLSLNRVGYVIRKKCVATAVMRNRIRRVLKAALQQSTLSSTHWDIVVIVRSKLKDIPQRDLFTILCNQWKLFDDYLLSL